MVFNKSDNTNRKEPTKINVADTDLLDEIANDKYGIIVQLNSSNNYTIGIYTSHFTIHIMYTHICN